MKFNRGNECLAHFQVDINSRTPTIHNTIENSSQRHSNRLMSSASGTMIFIGFNKSFHAVVFQLFFFLSLLILGKLFHGYGGSTRRMAPHQTHKTPLRSDYEFLILVCQLMFKTIYTQFSQSFCFSGKKI